MIPNRKTGVVHCAKPQIMSGSITGPIVFRSSCGTLSACCRSRRWSHNMTALSIATKTNPVLDSAIAYANRGLPVFPCDPATKRPYTAKGFKDATTDVNQICDWWTHHPTAMIGLPTGAASGFWALDIDVKPNANGEIAPAQLQAANGVLPP